MPNWFHNNEEWLYMAATVAVMFVMAVGIGSAMAGR